MRVATPIRKNIKAKSSFSWSISPINSARFRSFSDCDALGSRCISKNLGFIDAKIVIILAKNNENTGNTHPLAKAAINPIIRGNISYLL